MKLTQQETVEMIQMQFLSRWRSAQECGALRERKGAADLCEHQDVQCSAETINAQKVSANCCGYHQTGWNQTVQSVKTKSGPTFRNNRLLKKQKNRRIDACRRCTTAAKWVAGKTLEDERLKLSEELVELQDAQMNLEQFIAQNMAKNDRMERGVRMVAIERVKTLELPSRL